jgi:hypothetical protein
MSKTLPGFIGVIVFVAVWSLIFHDTSRDWRAHQRLARSGVQVTGAVTAKEPMNQASIRYDYFVDGVRYSGGPCGVHERFNSVRLGDRITVTYLPDSPSTSTCEDPQTGYSARSGILFIIVPCFALLAAGLTSFGLYRHFGTRPPGPSNQAMQPTAGRSDASST